MFTGIIEAMGRVESIEKDQGNIHLTISSPISDELKTDQSIAHDGVCLTVVSQKPGMHTVTAIAETLDKTNLGTWQKGSIVNLERCMIAGSRLDGHIVQGHVDSIGTCTQVRETGGSWAFHFEHDPDIGLTVSKGSICVNGASLTVVDSSPGQFSVAIIPYTYEHTGFSLIQPKSQVNLEFDILGKYIQRLYNQQKPI